jgi:hypothetical protein
MSHGKAKVQPVTQRLVKIGQTVLKKRRASMCVRMSKPAYRCMPLLMPFQAMMKKNCMRMGRTVPMVLMDALSSMSAKSWEAADFSTASAGPARAERAAVVFENSPLASRGVMNLELKTPDAVDAVVRVVERIFET